MSILTIPLFFFTRFLKHSNLFQMTPNGVPTKAVASVTTSDYEYPKIATLHCSYATPSCFFQTGVGG